MKNRYVDQLNMLDEVSLYSDNNSEEFEDDVPDYATTLTAFKAKVTAIKNKDGVVQKPTKGIADNKKSLKKQVCKEGASIAKAVRAYASKNDLPELSGEVQYSRSDLVKKRDNRLPQILRNIESTANTLITVTPPAPNPLAGSKIDAARLAAFEALITQYETASPKPRNAIVGKKTGNQEIGVLFHDANVILKDQLDGLAEQVSDSFYQGYLNARIIVDSVTRHTQIAGNIKDASDNSIVGVLVTAIGQPYTIITDGTPKTVNGNTYNTLSDENGAYSVKTPEFQTSYTLKITKVGYADIQVAGLQVHRGQITNQDITMSPGA